MANMNVKTPRFYVDTINYLLSRGVTQDGEFDVTATGGSGTSATRGIQTGSEIELFDMNPLNKVSFDTSGDVDSQVLVTIDTQSASSKKNFIAILNHNLKSAKGKIRVFAGDADDDHTAVDAGNAETADVNWLGASTSEIVNADTITVGGSNTSVVVEPGTDGSTIFTFNETNERYWAIQFEGADGGSGNATDEDWGTTNLFVGCILLGEYFDMPNAPDLSVTSSVIFDGVDIVETVGGKRFSNMRHSGRTHTATSKSPFTLAYPAYEGYGGRLAYDMSFSYLNATSVFPNRYQSLVHTDDTVISDVWNKTNGNHLPFIFSVDNDYAAVDGSKANSESVHTFARFANDSLNLQQVAPDVWNVGFRVEEEF